MSQDVLEEQQGPAPAGFRVGEHRGESHHDVGALGIPDHLNVGFFINVHTRGNGDTFGQVDVFLQASHPQQGFGVGSDIPAQPVGHLYPAFPLPVKQESQGAQHARCHDNLAGPVGMTPESQWSR